MLIQKIRKSSKAKAYLALLTTSIVWGTTWVFSKAAVMEMPALQMAAIRQLIAGLAMVCFFIFYKKLPCLRPENSVGCFLCPYYYLLSQMVLVPGA